MGREYQVGDYVLSSEVGMTNELFILEDIKPDHNGEVSILCIKDANFYKSSLKKLRLFHIQQRDKVITFLKVTNKYVGIFIVNSISYSSVYKYYLISSGSPQRMFILDKHDFTPLRD